MAFVKTILFRKDRTWLLAMIMIAALIGVTLTNLFSVPTQVAHAAAPNGFTSQVYQDSDGDGVIDQVVIVINGSEDLTTCTVTDTEVGTDWTYVGNDIGGSLASSGNTHSCVLSTETVTLKISGANAGTTGHSTAPTIAYDNDDADDSIRNATDILGTVSAANLTDDAGPMIKSLTIEDTATVDGLIDKITVTFSENIDTDDSAAPVIGDFGTLLLPDGQTVSAATITDPAGSASTVVLTAISNQSTKNTAAGSTAISGDLSSKWVDGSSNTPHVTGGTGNESVTDSAAPYPVTVTFYDATSNDGKLDIITSVWSENLTAKNNAASEGNWAITSSSDFTSLVEGTVECNSGSAGVTECDYNFTTATVKTSVGDLSLAYTAGTSVTDGTNNSGNFTFTSASTPAFTDAAKPIVVSLTPASAATGASLTADILIVFSEAMENTAPVEATEFTISPDVGTYVGSVTTTTVADDTYTINPAPSLACLVTYTVTTTAANIDDASSANNILNDSASEDGDWSFTTGSCPSSSSGGSSSTVAKTYTVGLTSHDDGVSVTAGSTETITWTTGGTGESNFVNVLYSTDGGANYTTIIKNAANTGSINWTVPNIASDEANIRIETTDLADVLAVDVSTLLFSIALPGAEAPSDTVTAPATDESGASPITGEIEAISAVNVGDYITSPGFSTIYYLDGSLNRHPFFNLQIFLTWQDSFASVVTVTDATLATLQLVSPMLPKHEIVLVKIQSDPKVYAVTDSGDIFKPTLRWVSSELLATSIYGAEWADYIIDIPVTLFGRFGFGEDITSVSHLSADMNIMKKRDDL